MAKLALLIGVSEYEVGLPGLPSAAQDIAAVKQVLEDGAICGFDQVTVLLNPSRQMMEEEIYLLFANRHKNDLILLYFSGHGIKDEQGKLYLTSRNTRSEMVEPTSVAASFVQARMTASRAKQQILILDCCFSGAFSTDMTVKAALIENISTEIRQQLAPIDRPEAEGRAVLTSSTATQYSFEQHGELLSVYTRYLVEGLQSGAADRDENGLISVDELHEYARSKVQEVSTDMKPQIFAAREGYKINLAKALVSDPKLRYRKEVEARVTQGQGKLSVFAKKLLESKQVELAISAEEAKSIEDAVLQPYREYEKKLQEYEQAIRDAVRVEYPFTPETEADLQDYQKALELKAVDIVQIEEQILTPLKVITKTQTSPSSAQSSNRQDVVIPSGSPAADLFNLLNFDSTATASPTNRVEVAKKSEQNLIEDRKHQILSLKTRSFKFTVVTLADNGQENNRETKHGKQFLEDLGNGLSLSMVVIPAGSFMMGSSPTQGVHDERPQHLVNIKSFLLSRYPITQAQWAAIAQLPKINSDLELDPSNFKGRKGCPVECVSWDDSFEFCQRLTQKTGRVYRLPSEAEWEYTCRAGTSTLFHFGETISSQFANYKDMHSNTYRRGTTRVDYFKTANAFGLSDMHGNVWEWCADPWHESYIAAPTDGSVWAIDGDKSRRVARGGSWDVEPYSSARRHRYNRFAKDKTCGFRVALSL